jgi:HlyD family secretion protein
MKSIPSSENATALLRRPAVLAVIAVCAVLLLYLVFRPARNTNGATSYHEVTRGNFTVTVVEGGTLTAVSEVSIRNEVEGTARVISIIPEGSYVKKGDLLVELDSAQAQDQYNQQQINFEKARFAVEQARAQLEIQRSATNSEYLAAELKFKLARIDLEKYVEGQRLVDLVEASNKVVQARSQLAVNSDTYTNSINLAAKGYETKQKVDQDRLALLNTANALLVASNTLTMLEKYDVVKQYESFNANVLQAQQELERVISQNVRKMAQFEADLTAQENTLVLNEQKLSRDKRNLDATKIYAPQDGLVVYQVSENRFSSESLIEGGATVRNRQELIKLPDLSRMKVTVKVHESHVNMVRPGLPAYVILDSNPDVRYAGTVEKVAPLPDTQSRFGNPNLKVYNTEIYITETPKNVKPGVSAKAEIVITNIADALSVPLQAITTYRGKQVAYVVNGGSSAPREVELGMFNTKFIQVASGLKEGDRVLLSPPFDTQEKDLEGSVLAADEKAKLAPTNAPVRPTKPASDTPPGERGFGPIATVANGAPADGQAAPGQDAARRGGFNREEFMKQFDKNGDGQIDESEREAMRTAMAARFAGGSPDGAGGPPQGGMPNREDMMKRFDKNGDGKLDDSEREAMRSSMGGQGAPGGFNREEMMKRFDKNGDGQLDEEERAAMRASMGGGKRGQGGGQGRRDPSGQSGQDDGGTARQPRGATETRTDGAK